MASSCSKGGHDDYSPLRDTCLMQRNAAFRKGKWKLIKVDSFDYKETRVINFVTDSLYIEERPFSKFDTAKVVFIDCNTMEIQQYIHGQLNSRKFGIEVHYSPLDSLFTIVNYDQLGGKNVLTYKKL